jgi:resuscitation-promoting factor RpfB
VNSFPVRRIAQAAVLTGVVAAAVGFASFDKSVTLAVDGKTSSVHTFSKTVGDVLAKEHIRLGPHDVVAPAPSTALSDGQKVTVRYGRLLSVTIDGKQHQYWTTATTVASALSELGIRAEQAQLSVSRSQPLGRAGLALTVTTPKSITVTADGRTRTAETTGATVGDALRQLKITPGPIDRVSPAVTTPVTASGLKVTVARVKQKTLTATEPVAFTTDKRDDASMAKGSTKTLTSGQPGAKVVTYKETWVDGKLAGRVAQAQKVTRQPVAAVVAVGTKAPAPASGAIPSSGGLNWAALANCESGGNPQAVDPSGTYYGLYQFSISTWQANGGSGKPTDASSAEQTQRAQILYNKAGRGQWPVCGKYL